MDSTGDISPLLVGGGRGGLFALLTLAPLPTGFLLGMTDGGLLTLVRAGSRGRGASITLVAMLEGIDLTAVSLGGSAGREAEGRESFLTGRATWATLSGFSREGGAGRAFEKRERPPDLGDATGEASMILTLCARGPRMAPLCGPYVDARGRN